MSHTTTATHQPPASIHPFTSTRHAGRSDRGGAGCSSPSPFPWPARSAISSPDGSIRCRLPSSAASSTGAGIGAAQWALLRRRGIGVGWIPATAAGLGAGLAVGAALVSYRTDITSLALMGAICGLAVGIAQGAMLGNTKRMLGWSAVTAALWAVGWSVTTAGGISVDQQFVVFGAYGAITSTFLQSMIIGSFIPAKAVQS